MIRRLIALTLACCATAGQAADDRAPRACSAADPTPARLAADEHGAAMKIARCVHYADRGGEYQLYLLDTEDRRDGDDTMSSSLAAQLFKRQPDGTLVQRWVLHDRIGEGEAGAWFSKRLTEFRDLDGDGSITPVLVLRFVPFENGDPDRAVDAAPFAGRLKIILFRGDTKVAIRAVTGSLDDERHTTATDSFFALPQAQQRYVQRKLREWTEQQVFVSDDNHGTFMPRHEREH
jgi:hypothetical protein